MAQTRLFSALATRFSNEFGRAWIHPAGTRAYGKLEFPVHKVAVHGWYPDLLALTDDDRVVAVVSELEHGDLMRGLGRAVALKDGVHAVLLAGERDRLERVRDSVVRAGVGLCLVGPGQQVEFEFPASWNSGSTRQFVDVVRELELLARRPRIRRRFPSLALGHPLHYAAPVLAVRPGSRQSRQEVAALLLERWGLPGPKTEAWQSAVVGAILFGLLQDAGAEGIELTERGALLRRVLLERYGARDLRALADEPEPLVALVPWLALVLQAVYLAEPDVSLVWEVLGSCGESRPDMTRLMAHMFHRYPNAALNLLVRPDAQNRFAAAWRQADLAALLRPRKLREVIHPAVVGPFKRQLVHLGLLRSGCPVWRDVESYDPGRDFWPRNT